MNTCNRILTAEIALCAITILLSGCGAPPTISGPVVKEKLVDGVYESSHAQLPNIATVRVTINDHRIADIQIVSHLALKGKKAEGPIAKRIIESQSTKVDAVTGATNSSHTLMKAVQKAIDKAYPK